MIISNIKSPELDRNWHDHYLEKITIDYADIIIKLETDITGEEKGSIVNLICKNFIGISYLGQWDENVVEEITISDDDALIDVAKKQIEDKNDTGYMGGGIRKFDGQWICVNVKLIDGLCIKIICSDVEIIDEGVDEND